MKHADLPLREIEMIAGTRVALGVGLGLLLADKFSQPTRKQLGWALFLFGTLTTVPLRYDVFRRLQHAGARRSSEAYLPQ